MVALKLEAAAPGVGARNGGKAKSQGSVFSLKTYSARPGKSMPSAEISGKISAIVPRDGKLFAVSAFTMGGAE
ncbi:hypothetical protein [Jiella marina]|uniref:hypothetical protein n=1 Tax=Jiella sp. LLJ827 TaxID=2917712 RepID=UPI0021014FAF|nr:hypothetical protein [Jiella sp. LLJ827]MCQ0986487.1 hypothetical protein [Jiella sp. LLJ827]